MSRDKNKPAKTFWMHIFLVAFFAVILSGCVQNEGGNGSGTGSQGAQEGVVLAIGSEFSKELSVEESSVFQVVAEIRNDGKIPLENVNAVFYNFGSNLEGCPDVYAGELAPGDSYEAVCEIEAKPKDQWGDPTKSSFSQDISVKVRYSFPISGAFESIRVLSPEEYARTNPGSKSEEKAVSIGPVTLKAEFQKQPAVSGREFPILLSFIVKASGTEGIESTESLGTVASAQLRIPSSFSFSGKGSFDSAGVPCGGEYICATKSGWLTTARNGSILSINVAPPELSVPEETFSAKFDAEGFTIFKIAKKRIVVSASSATGAPG